MGRKKIQIKAIVDEKTRLVTFAKRKNGLFKKAYELSVLCDCEIALLVFTRSNRLYQYASSSVDHIINRRSTHTSASEFFTNRDMENHFLQQHSVSRSKKEALLTAECDIDGDHAMSTEDEKVNDCLPRRGVGVDYQAGGVSTANNLAVNGATADRQPVLSTDLSTELCAGAVTTVASSDQQTGEDGIVNDCQCSSAFVSPSRTTLPTSCTPPDFTSHETVVKQEPCNNLSTNLQDSAYVPSSLQFPVLTDNRVVGNLQIPVSNTVLQNSEGQTVTTLVNLHSTAGYICSRNRQNLQGWHRLPPGVSPIDTAMKKVVTVSPHCINPDGASPTDAGGNGDGPVVGQDSCYDCVSDCETVNHTDRIPHAGVNSSSRGHFPSTVSTTTTPLTPSDGSITSMTSVYGIPTDLSLTSLPTTATVDDQCVIASPSSDFLSSGNSPSPSQPGAFVTVSGVAGSRLSRLKLLRKVPRLNSIQQDRQSQSLVTPGTFLPTPEVESEIEKLEVEQGRRIHVSSGCPLTSFHLQSNGSYSYPLDLSSLNSPPADAVHQDCQNFLHPISLGDVAIPTGEFCACPVAMDTHPATSSSMNFLSLQSLSSLGTQASRELLSRIPQLTVTMPSPIGYYIQAKHSNGDLQ